LPDYLANCKKIPIFYYDCVSEVIKAQRRESMEHYQYEITRHPAKLFNELVVFCSEKGECSLEEVPHDQAKQLEEILNERGRQGWELVLPLFGKDGILIFWKKIIE